VPPSAGVYVHGRRRVRRYQRALLPRLFTWVSLFFLFVSFSAPGEPNTNAARSAPARPRIVRPFALFWSTRWYPSRPRTDNATDALSVGLMLALPCVTGAALWILYRKSKSTGRLRNWGRLAAANALALTFFLSTLLLLAELWFRLCVDTTDSLGFTKVCERWVRRHWHLNAAGCRDNVEYSAAIAAGKRRLTFVGDSFTAGHGIKNVEDRFANRLRALHPDWEVQVLATVGLDTGAETELLKKAFFREYELDEVVLVYCINDVGDLLLAPGQAFEGRLPDVNTVGPWFTRGSYFLDLVYNRYKANQNPFVRDYFSFVKAGYRGEYWETQKKRLKEFRDLVESHGGRLSVMTFPFLHNIGPNYDYGFVHEELSGLWKELRVPELDLLPVYQGLTSKDVTVNAHDAHPNELANRLAADAINQQLWGMFTNRGPGASAGQHR
jgi:hypothetical protein